MECLMVEEWVLVELWFGRVGELASNVERENGEELGDNDLRGIESDLLIDRGLACRPTIDSV
jgi:hypothetical protein